MVDRVIRPYDPFLPTDREHSTDETDAVQDRLLWLVFMGGVLRCPAESVRYVMACIQVDNARSNPNSIGYESYDNGLFTPAEDLTALSTTAFTTLGHPAFPRYSVRIKKSSDFCDTTVK